MKKILSLLLLLGILTLPKALNAQTYHDLSSSNFNQNWNNASLITANDDWSSVPSIRGFFLANSASTTSTSRPDTLLTDFWYLTGAATPTLDVNADLTVPNTFNTGGVTEFALTNPTIALAGSGTADAPYLLLYMNTTGRQDVTVSYRLRDLENGADNAAQAIALQFRVGTSGLFTNIPAAFVADATLANDSTTTQLVSAILPASVNNQSQVQIRIISSNAAGNDEWVGIDDISVTSTAASGVLTIGTTSLSSGITGTAYNQTISASGGTAPYSFAVTGGALPGGLSLSLGGVISGTPSATGIFNFTVTVTDNVLATDDQALSITITGNPPVITNVTTPESILISSGSPSPIVINANVTDDVSISAVRLVRYSNGTPSDSSSMTFVSGSLYTVSLSGLSNGDSLSYRVSATDNDGLYTLSSQNNMFVGETPISVLRAAVNGSGVQTFSGYAVRVSGTINTPNAVFSPTNFQSFLESGGLGYGIFDAGNTGSYPVGTTVSVVGEVGQFNGLSQVTNVDTVIVNGSASATPTTQTIPVLNTFSTAENFEGRLVRVTGVQFTSTGNYPSNNTIRVLLGSDSMNVFIDTDTDINGTPILTGNVDVVGVLSQFDNISPFDGGYQIVPRSLADITITSATPTQLQVLSVNGGRNVSANVPFSVIVRSVTGGGSPGAVSVNTNYTLSFSGSGLTGTLSGTIDAGTFADTLTGLTIGTSGQSAVTVTATRTSGDALTAAISNPFNVLGTTTKLAFTSVPSSGNVSQALTFVVQGQRADNSLDSNFSGTVTLSKVSPAFGTLSGTTSQAAILGSATFAGLSVDVAGAYTFGASATGLTSATSSAVTVSSQLGRVLAYWDFRDLNSTVDSSTAANATRTITLDSLGTASTTLITFTSGSNNANRTAWKVDTTSWRIGFSTLGYQNISVSARQRSSNTGPRDFRLQYSLDGTSWTDVANIPNLTTTLTKTTNSLPAAVENLSLVYLRWIPRTNVSVNASIVATGGVSNIDSITVSGTSNGTVVTPINFSTTLSGGFLGRVSLPTDIGFDITFTGASSGGSFAVTRNDGFRPTNYLFGLPTSGTAQSGTVTVTTVSDRWWTITHTGGGTYNLAIDARDLPGALNKSLLVIVKRTDNTTPWSTLTTSYNGTSLSAASTGFSDFGIGGDENDNPLPVEIRTFTSSLNQNGVLLNWKTASETNNAGFAVLRDGREIASYQSNNVLRGKGTTSSESDYNYVDRSVEIGKTYVYKLRSYDLDGSIHDYNQTVSQEVTNAVTGVPRENKLSQNYPNPFNPSTMIEFSLKLSEQATITIYDLLGRVIVKNTIQANAGVNNYNFNGSALGSGVYFYQVQTASYSSKTYKMTLMK